MFLKRKGLPDEGTLVLCTVNSVQSHSVFCDVDEYGISGMIHISEIAPGRIRNIRDYVREGKVVVCKVLGVDEERGQVDLSLRRVNEGQRRAKLGDVKLEEKAEKTVEFAARQLKMEPKKLYDEFALKVLESYDYIFHFFMDVVEGKAGFEQLGVDAKLAKELTGIVMQRMRPSEVEVKRNLKLISYASDGVERVRRALEKAVKLGAAVKYIGAGNYQLAVKAADYKTAEQVIEKAETAAAKSIDGVGELKK